MRLLSTYLLCAMGCPCVLGTDPGQPNHLTRAAACIEKGDDHGACAHLGLYLQMHPEHRNARFYYGELLLKLRRTAEARDQFERAIRQEQEQPEPDLKHLVHCHTRLLEIGDSLRDAYLTRLHRGIALVLLARRSATLAGAPGTPSIEALLCKAAAELKRAQALRPADAQPYWYLHIVWRQLGQHEAARRCLAAAQRRAAGADLTPIEQRDLHLACLRLDR
jgi:tetratricopeptide (TPR) repeat protein